MLHHPFDSIPQARVRAVFFAALGAYLVLQLVLLAVDAPLRNESAPAGIVSFEVAGSLPASAAILNSWQEEARLMAAFGLGLDFAFMIAYSSVIALACIWGDRILASLSAPLAGGGRILAWGIWVAVVLDSAENVMLMQQLLRGAASPLAEIASLCAMGKFTLISLGLLYAVYAFSIFLLQKDRQASSLVSR